MKKYASDFVRMIEDQKKNYSAPDYLDLLNELNTELQERIDLKQKELGKSNEQEID